MVNNTIATHLTILIVLGKAVYTETTRRLRISRSTLSNYLINGIFEFYSLGVTLDMQTGRKKNISK